MNEAGNQAGPVGYQAQAQQGGAPGAHQAQAQQGGAPAQGGMGQHGGGQAYFCSPAPEAPMGYGPPMNGGHSHYGSYQAPPHIGGHGGYAAPQYAAPQHAPYMAPQPAPYMPPHPGYMHPQMQAQYGGAGYPGYPGYPGYSPHPQPMPGYGQPQQPPQAPYSGDSGLASFFNFRDERFIKGALTGAALTFILTNESFQKNSLKSILKVWHMLQGGVEEMKERIQDLDAEVKAESQQDK